MPFPDKKIKNKFQSPSKDNKLEKIEIFRIDIKKLSYEESISELERILTNVQDENISLDQIQENYIKGQLLLKHCEELLQVVEQEVNEINPEFLDID